MYFSSTFGLLMTFGKFEQLDIMFDGFGFHELVMKNSQTLTYTAVVIL